MGRGHPGSVVRLLADDMLVETQRPLEESSEEHAYAHFAAVEDTFAYVASIGGKVAPSKCKHLSTDEATRKWLRGRRSEQLKAE
eukprot:195886-Alexandrium_andersonii.AAC.1